MGEGRKHQAPERGSVRDVVASEKIVRACVRQHGESSSGEQLHADTTADAREKRTKRKEGKKKKTTRMRWAVIIIFTTALCVCAHLDALHVHTGERA